MKALLFFPVLAVTACSLYASGDSLPTPPRFRQSIEVSGLGYINSTTLNNDFIRAFYRGDYIDEDLKFSATRKMEKSNLIGGNSKVGITYTTQLLEGFNRPVLSFSFFDRTYVDLKFSEDMFRVAFYGNKQYEGQTAELGNMALNLLRYQQFRLGWSKGGDANHGSYGFAVSLLSGEQNVTANVPRADLFTEAGGTAIDLDIAFDIHRTDTARRGFFAQNGMGLSTDFFYEMPYTCWRMPSTIRFDLKDLGFIRWSSNSQHYSAGSTYHYEGVEVEDIFQLDSTALSVDNLIDNNTTLKYKSYLTDLPGSLDVRTRAQWSRQLAFEKGVTWRFHTSAKLYYFVKLHFLLGRNRGVDAAYVLGYGGYGRFNSGLDISADLGNKYSFHFMNHYLFSDVTAQSTTGLGIFVKLTRKF